VRPGVRADGCSRCGHTGFHGRIPVTEMFTMTASLAELIARRATPEEVVRAAAREGMRTLLQSALDRVGRGETTLDEVQRVIGFREQRGPEEERRVPGRERWTTAATVPWRDVPAARDDDGDEGPARILLVDDDGTTRTVGRGLLTGCGYRVTEASDGPAALDLLPKAHYSLIVLDLDMPRMGGREVLKTVRSGIHTAGIPVIVLTGSEDPEGEVELMDLGADDYIRKPIDPPRFITRVRATLRRSSL